jgi:periplasmic divalent cation tolerance protein
MYRTTAADYERLQAMILELHPYDLPAVYAVPVELAHEPYAAWVKANTR